MAELQVDPLRFLNIKKKRENNRQRADLKRLLMKQPLAEEASRFVLPSFSSQNSLENGQSNRIKKEYNPLKYFNPEIEQYLNKLKHVKIANSPIMPTLPQQCQKSITQAHKKQQSKESEIINKNSNISAIQNKNESKNASTGVYFNFANTFKNVNSQMMTFAKDQQKVIGMSTQKNAPTFQDIDKGKTLYNFNKPGLKKSGSYRMMEKMQEDQNFKERMVNNQGISPWQLPENAQQNVQLQQCEVCSRKFNPKSYLKHIKVCQKVFFQKRKPFNSRQNSVQKKG